MIIGIIWDALYREPVCLQEKFDEFSFQSGVNFSFCRHNFAVISLAYHERLVWAKRNIQNKSRETFEKTVELDVSKMNIYGQP